MGRVSDARERLIQATIELIWVEGYGAVTVDSICERANVKKGSFYHFFDSKEALLRAVLEQYIELLRPMVVNPAFSSVNKPLDRIFAILAGYRERILMTNCTFGCPLGRLALEVDPENAPAHKLIAQNFQGWIDAVRECLVEMRPSLPRNTNIDALATFILVTMEGGVMLSRSYRSVDPYDRAVEQLREHFRLLLQKQKPKKLP